jgi:hypothetical protein
MCSRRGKYGKTFCVRIEFKGAGCGNLKWFEVAKGKILETSLLMVVMLLGTSKQSGNSRIFGNVNL